MTAPIASNGLITTNAVFGLSLVNRMHSMKSLRRLWADTSGGIFVEYLLLMTIVGIGAIAGLATVRGALLNELLELASAIAAITP